MLKLGLLASHNGSNVEAILTACQRGDLDARPVALVCNNREAHVLARAANHGVPARVINATTHPDERARDAAIRVFFQKQGAELLVLAGYMKKLGPQVLEAFNQRIVNIHPALLPRFGGQGMFGERVHQAVLEAGDPVTGVTIHMVDGEYDHGRILAQTEVPVNPGDTPSSLAARVLAREHEFLVETLQRLIRGDLRLTA